MAISGIKLTFVVNYERTTGLSSTFKYNKDVGGSREAHLKTNYYMGISIKKNFAYKSILTISTYIMGFITFPYVSRVLGVEHLGLVSFVDNTVSYFLLFATMGISFLGVREIAAVKTDPKQREIVFSRVLGINLLFTLIAILIYILCIEFFPKLNQYKELFYIGTAKILFTAFVIEWFYTGIEDFRYITLRTIIIKTLYVVSVFILIKDVEDYLLYFILTVGVVVVNAIVNMAYLNKFVRIRLKHMCSMKYVKQNIILGIYAIMTSMYLTFNVMFLGLVSNNVEVGYYTTAYKLYSVILGFFTAFTSVMLPRMSALLADGDKERFQQLINKSFTAMFTFSIPLILFSMILAPQIIYVLSGPGYEGAILPMRIIMPAMLFVGIAQVLAVQILMPMKKDKVLLTASILGAIVSLLINLTIVSDLQSKGTAIVLICSEILVTMTYIVYALYKRLVQIPIKPIIRSILLSIPSLVVCIGCKALNTTPYLILVFSILLGGGIWCVMEYYTKESILRRIY